MRYLLCKNAIKCQQSINHVLHHLSQIKKKRKTNNNALLKIGSYIPHIYNCQITKTLFL